MYKIAIITHKETNCGVHNFARTIFDSIRNSNKYRYEFVTVNDIHEFAAWYNQSDADAIVVNYHHDVTPWYTESIAKQIPLPQFMITGHDQCNYYPSINGHFVCDPTIPSNDFFVALPRPIPYDPDVVYTPPGKVLKIGSFGFGQASKNFPGVVKMVNDQFIEPVILNLHISYGAFVDASGETAHNIANECRAIANENITLNITHDFKTNKEIIQFLNSNDINIFNYDDQPGRGVSSCIDFALASRKPFAISNSNMYRHVSHNTKILLSQNKIKDIVRNSVMPLVEFYRLWSNENLINTFENVFDHKLTDLIKVHESNLRLSKNKFKFPFEGLNKITTQYSQAGQDLFVLAVLKGKTNGTYFEIGTNDPLTSSNTYLLETGFEWRGCGVDIQPVLVEKYRQYRKNPVVLGDATTINVTETLSWAGILDTHIDYLSIDCEPAATTYQALCNIPLDRMKFSVITYEHDAYLAGETWLHLSREHLRRNGYVLVVSKLAVTRTAYFEDWWVHPELVDMDYVRQLVADNDDIKYFVDYLFHP